MEREHRNFNRLIGNESSGGHYTQCSSGWHLTGHGKRLADSNALAKLMSWRGVGASDNVVSR